MNNPKTAQPGALGVLQLVQGQGPDIEKAAAEVLSYHKVNGHQQERLRRAAEAFEAALVEVVAVCPPGPERSTAISRLREAKMWASAAISLEGL